MAPDQMQVNGRRAENGRTSRGMPRRGDGLPWQRTSLGSGFWPGGAVQFVWRVGTLLPYFLLRTSRLLLRLANTRQGIANKHVDDSAAAITGGDKNGASRLFANFADDASFGTAGHRMKRA